MMKNLISKIVLVFLFISCSVSLFGQITEGTIKYERRTNLFKKYPDKNIQKWIGEKNKYSVDHFNLSFNDTASVYLPIEDPDRSDMMKWLVLQHTNMQYFGSKKNVSLINVFGQVVVIEDQHRDRAWKYTGKQRTIANYECKQVLVQVNDSTKLYAWFTTDILPQVGPENFFGLPGAILGVATEDGGTTYFATEVMAKKVDLTAITPKYNAKKSTDFKALKDRMIKEFTQKEAKPLVDDILLWQYY